MKLGAVLRFAVNVNFPNNRFLVESKNDERNRQLEQVARRTRGTRRALVTPNQINPKPRGQSMSIAGNKSPGANENFS